VPEKIADVFALLEPNAMIKAGGVDILDLMKEGIVTPQRLVNIHALKELNSISGSEKAGLKIGPNITLDALAADSRLTGAYRVLAQAASGAATPQIRNMATFGGNICQRPRCWYFRSHDFSCRRKGGVTCFALDGENQYHAIFGNNGGCVIVHPSATCVALLALDARIKIVSEKGEREILLSEFFIMPSKDITRENILKPNELITEISIPTAASNSAGFYFKQKEKQAFDWPIAEVAAVLTLDGGVCKDAKIVLGAAAPIPWRIPKAEQVLKNQKLSKELARKAAEEAMKDATPLSENSYKVDVFKAVITRTICWAAGIDPMK